MTTLVMKYILREPHLVSHAIWQSLESRMDGGEMWSRPTTVFVVVCGIGFLPHCLVMAARNHTPGSSDQEHPSDLWRMSCNRLLEPHMGFIGTSFAYVVVLIALPQAFQLRSCGGVVPIMQTAPRATNPAVPYEMREESTLRSVHD